MVAGFSTQHAEISITCVSNGFIVQMPLQENNEMGQYFKQGMEMVKGLLPKDDILEKIRNEQEKINEDETNGSGIMPLPNFHVFKEWKEVIAFLKTAKIN